MSTAAELPELGSTLTPERALAFEDEVRHEVGRGHQLKGLRLRAAAKCQACDNVVFEAPDGTWAVVHLTWKGSERFTTGREPGRWKRRFTRERPPWPWTERFTSVGALMAGLAEDHH